MSQTCRVKLTIVNRLGMHARPAMVFCDLAQTFSSTITVKREDTEVDGKSIMQLLMIAASKGSEIEVVAEGEDAEKAIAAIKTLVESGFDEE